jgi:hypothetical protein
MLRFLWLFSPHHEKMLNLLSGPPTASCIDVPYKKLFGNPVGALGPCRIKSASSS